jgi:hypothetical protein
MITLSNGAKQGESGDVGAPIWSAFNSNAQILNDHTHDGTDSEQINSEDINKQAVTLPTASWVAGARGFSQTVNCPGSVSLDKVGLRFRVKSGSLQHQFVNPTVEPTSLTSFVVIVNDSSLELECLFL